MKNKEKRMIAVLVIITIIVIIIAVIRGNSQKDANKGQEENTETKEEFVQVLEDGTKLNNSNKLQETKKIEGMEITNIQLTEKGNVTLLLGTVTNVSDTTQGGYPVNVKIIDKTGEEIITVAGFIGQLKPGENTQLSTSATFDYANAYDFMITKK